MDRTSSGEIGVVLRVLSAGSVPKIPSLETMEITIPAALLPAAARDIYILVCKDFLVTARKTTPPEIPHRPQKMELPMKPFFQRILATAIQSHAEWALFRICPPGGLHFSCRAAPQ